MVYRHALRNAAHPRAHRHRALARLHAERRDHHRDGVLVARAGAADRAGGARARLPGHPGRRVRVRGDLRRAQPGGRRALRGGRPAGAPRRERAAATVPRPLGRACVVRAAVIGSWPSFAPALAPADPVRNSLLDRLTPPMWAPGGSAAASARHRHARPRRAEPAPPRRARLARRGARRRAGRRRGGGRARARRPATAGGWATTAHALWATSSSPSPCCSWAWPSSPCSARASST